MGQQESRPRNVILVKDFVVGTCFKNLESSGNGPYNYCYKVTKIIKKRNGEYTVYFVNPLLDPRMLKTGTRRVPVFKILRGAANEH